MSQSRINEDRKGPVYATRERIEKNVIGDVCQITIRYTLENESKTTHFYYPSIAFAGKKEELALVLQKTLHFLANSPQKKKIRDAYWLPWFNHADQVVFPCLYYPVSDGGIPPDRGIKDKIKLELVDCSSIASGISLKECFHPDYPDSSVLLAASPVFCENIPFWKLSENTSKVPQWISCCAHDHNISIKTESASKQNPEFTESGLQSARIVDEIRTAIRNYYKQCDRTGEYLEENINKFKVAIGDAEFCFAKVWKGEVIFPEIDLIQFGFHLEQIINQLFENINDGKVQDSTKAICLYDALENHDEIIRIERRGNLKHTYTCKYLSKFISDDNALAIETIKKRKPKSHSGSHSSSYSSSSSSSGSASQQGASNLKSAIPVRLNRLASNDDPKFQLSNAKRTVFDVIFSAYSDYAESEKECIRNAMKNAIFGKQQLIECLPADKLENRLFDFEKFNTLQVKRIEELLEELIKSLKTNKIFVDRLTALTTAGKDKNRVLMINKQKKFRFELPQAIRGLESNLTAQPTREADPDLQRVRDNEIESIKQCILRNFQDLEKRLAALSMQGNQIDWQAEVTVLANFLSEYDDLPIYQKLNEYHKLEEYYHRLDEDELKQIEKYLKLYFKREKLLAEEEQFVVGKKNHVNVPLFQLIGDAVNNANAIEEIRLENHQLILDIENEKLKRAIHHNLLDTFLNFSDEPPVAVDIPRSEPVAIPVIENRNKSLANDTWADARLMEDPDNIVKQLKQVRGMVDSVDKNMTGDDLKLLNKLTALQAFVLSGYSGKIYKAHRTQLKWFLWLAENANQETITQIGNVLGKGLGIFHELLVLGREVDCVCQALGEITAFHAETVPYIIHAKNKLRTMFMKRFHDKRNKLNQLVKDIGLLLSDEEHLSENIVIIENVINNAIRQKDEFAEYRSSLMKFLQFADADFLRFVKEFDKPDKKIKQDADIKDWAVLTNHERQLYFENVESAFNCRENSFNHILNHPDIQNDEKVALLKPLRKSMIDVQAELDRRANAFRHFKANKNPLVHEQQLLNNLYISVKARIEQASKNRHVHCPIDLPDTQSPDEQSKILGKVHDWASKEYAKVNDRLQEVHQFHDCQNWKQLQDWHTRKCLQIFYQATDKRPKHRALAFNCNLEPACIPPAVAKPGWWTNHGGSASGFLLAVGGALVSLLGWMLLPFGGAGLPLIIAGSCISFFGLSGMAASAALGEKEIVHRDFTWQPSELKAVHNNTEIFKKMTRLSAQPPRHKQVRKAKIQTTTVMSETKPNKGSIFLPNKIMPSLKPGDSVIERLSFGSSGDRA